MQKFNNLTAIKKEYTNEKGYVFWLFRCDCGNETILRRCKVTSGVKKNCGCIKYYLKEDKHPNWKGSYVGKIALHDWVSKRISKPLWCVRCKSKPPKDLSNNGIYNRNLNNWEWLCRSCHLKKDGRDHRGEKNGAAKLTQKQVESIRKEYKKGWGQFTFLGKKYGVSYWTISQIINRRTWKISRA